MGDLGAYLKWEISGYTDDIRMMLTVLSRAPNVQSMITDGDKPMRTLTGREKLHRWLRFWLYRYGVHTEDRTSKLFEFNSMGRNNKCSTAELTDKQIDSFIKSSDNSFVPFLKMEKTRREIQHTFDSLMESKFTQEELDLILKRMQSLAADVYELSDKPEKK